MTNVPYGLGPLITNSLESWHGQTMRVLLLSVSLRTPLDLTPRCTPITLGVWRPERIFSLATNQSSQGIKQDKRKNLLWLLHRGPTAGMMITVNSPVCETNSNSRLIGPMSVFFSTVILFMTNDTKDKDKEKLWPSLDGNGSLKPREFYQRHQSP